MSSERMDISDTGRDHGDDDDGKARESSSGDTKPPQGHVSFRGGGGGTSGGCYVSTLMGFLLVLLGLVMVVGVAVVVFFAASRDPSCTLEGAADGLPPSGGIQDAVTSCKKHVENGGTAADGICSICPSSQTPPPPRVTSAATSSGAVTTTTTIPPYDRSKYRLPSNVTPLHYDLRLQPHIYGNDPSTFFFEGSVSIDVSCHDVTDTITLHVDHLTIDDSDITVREKASGLSVNVRQISNEVVPQFLHIWLSENLRKGMEYEVVFARFTGLLKNKILGFYYTSYMDGDTTVYVAATHFAASYARMAFPCFDEPAMKATFRVTLLRRTNTGRNYRTLSNMNRLRTDSSSSSSSGWVEDVYQTTMRTSTYLLAFLVSDFVSVSNHTMGVRFSIWARPNAIQYAERALELGQKIFESFETRFSPSYTTDLDKLDNVAVPGFGYSAMENWGIIYYGEPLLFRPGISTVSTDQYIGLIMAHEISHMWFGNVVTPQRWRWLWLSEAMASFWHMRTVYDTFPTWRMTDEHVVNKLHSIMTSDALATSRPLTADVETPAEFDALLDGITYRKGPFIIRMMSFIMGHDNFVAALNNYLLAHQFSNVKQSDLWTALNNVSLPGVNMGERMDPWVTQMGYPVVMVTRSGDGMLRLQQQRFLMGSEEGTDYRYRNAPYNYKWEIPITMASSRDPNFTKTAADIVWMEINQSVTTVPDPTVGEGEGEEGGGWFILNVQQYGYYRVSYDRRNWLSLIRQLNSDHQVIHPINRAQIINDAWNLAKANMLDMETALKTVDFLSKELDYLPWRSFAREISYVEMMLERSELYTALQSFLLKLVSGPLQQLSLDITPDTEPLGVYTRQLLSGFACSYGQSACINQALQQFDHWTATGNNRIDANLRYRFYCTAMERRGRTEWTFLLKRFRTETDAQEKRRLRQALACAREPVLLRRLLDMALNDSQSMDVGQIIADVSANRWGRDIAFRFLVERFSSLADLLGSRLSSVIDSVAAHFNSHFDLHRLDFLESTTGSSAYSHAIREARTHTQTNMEWLQTHAATLKTWLQREEEQQQQRVNYRLPGHVIPRHYTIQLQPHMYGLDPSAFTFDGSVTIRVHCVRATDTLTLHLDRLSLSDTAVSVKQENSQRELFEASSYEEIPQFLHLHLRDRVEPGKTYLVQFRHFSGPLTTDGSGLYLSHYRDGDKAVYLATTQMEIPYARKALPCFDEPQLKATFDVTLVRRNDTDRHYISLANTPLLDTDYMQDTDGHWWAKDRFETTPIMPTYLLAFIVCDFLHLENTTASDPNVTFRTYARPNAIQWARRAHQYGMKMFDWMNRRFKPRYSQALSKLDNVAVPDFIYGAMENWGLIIYREAILYLPDVTSAANEFWTASIFAHEIAHMWFGNYVSPRWWRWLWLNEAFASWWSMYVSEQVLPEWRVTSLWVTSKVHSAMESDALATSHPMNADVESPGDVISMSSKVNYYKGAAVVRMMQFIMGLDTFIEGLNLHLANNLYGNAASSDLLSALDQKMREQGLGADYMTAKMDPWVSQMGFPVVMVTRTPRGFQLTQKRFLIGSEENTDKKYKDALYDYQWEIPVIYATSDNPNMAKSRDDILWLNKDSHLVIPDSIVNDTDAWILLNINQTAYCRVLYDNATWRALIGQLNRDPTVIPEISRGQIINDAWNLAKAGMLGMDIALSTLDFLQGERELAPWRAFAREMNYVETMLRTTPLFPRLQTYILDRLLKPLQTLTLNIDDNMAPSDVFVRTLIAQYACNYGLVGCVNTAKRLFAEWKNTGVNGINANLRYQFYCTAVAEGDESDWNFVYTQYKSSDESTELANLRHALSCSQNPVLIRKLLSMTMDATEIRTQDISRTLEYVASNPMGRDLAFQFFVDNFDRLHNRLEVHYLGRVLTAVTSHFNTDYSLQQLNQLSRVRDVTDIRSTLEEAMERTRSNIAWLRTHYDVIQDWLTREKTTPAPPAPGSYRLPGNLKPLRYDVRLQPHIYGADPGQFFFEGNVTIYFTCTSPTTTITLHQDRLTIDPSSIVVTNVINPYESFAVADVTEDKQFHFYHIHLTRRMAKYNLYSVQILNFRGDMRKTSKEGLYLSSYRDGDRTIYLATTQMEPTYARQVLPCFDEPAMKATFTVTLLRRHDTDRSYISLSNMPKVSSTVLDGSWTADTFNQSMKMSTYLLAFIVCDFSYLSNISTRYPVETRTYARPNRIEDARLAQDYAVQILDWLNDHFDPNYEKQLRKVDHIAIPDLSFGAMENWGLITYRETLLYPPVSTASHRDWVAGITCHELAHMWFGNKVSPKWWSWVWLNEAFADYWQTYVVEQLYPSWKSRSVVDTAAGVFYAMQVDSYTSSHPLTNPVHTPAEIVNQFDTITYTKGGAIIGMMHMIMGEHFIPALNVYLTDHELGNAEPQDLFDSLNKYIRGTPGIDVDMAEKMEPWVNQMGYPVVSVHRHREHLHLTQRRFLLGSASSPDTGTHGYRYEVPITYTTSSEKNFTKSRTDIMWLPANGSVLTIQLTSPDWVVVNLRHQGYYRVNYDVTTWKALIAQLNTDHTVLDEMNRATLMDDAFNLVKAELLPLDIALQTVDYMKKEMDYGPWRVFARETDHLEMMIERTDMFAAFQRFMQELVSEPIQAVGFEPPASNEPPVEVYKMYWIISDACKYDHVACVTKATSLVSDWMNGLNNAINVNLRSIFYCTAVREGGHDVWQFIYQQYQAEGDATEKFHLRSALGCAKDPTILYTFLDMCLYDEEVPQYETPSCLYAVAANRYGRDVALNFLLEHFPQLRQRFSAGSLGSMVYTVTQHFHSNFHLSQLQFLRDSYDVSGMENTLDMVQQRALTSRRWMEVNADTIRQWLANKTSDTAQLAKLDYRLPTSVTPYHYDLELQPEIYTSDPSAFTFNGTVTIFIQVREPTTSITLHSYLLDEQTIRDSARLLFPNGTDTGYVQEVTFDAVRHFLRVAVRRELRVRERFGLYLEFRAALMGSKRGLFYTSYQASDGSTVYMVSTQFEAIRARRVFPCFDEPALKATVNTTLVRRGSHNGRAYKSWSNNDLWYTEDRGNGYFADHFLTTPFTSTYLLAFIVADFQCLTSVTKHGLKYRTCAMPDRYQQGQLAQDWGVRTMEWLEDHFDPPYVMPKLDSMVVPGFSGAMENWGLVTYFETLLFQEGVTLTTDKSTMVFVVAHELAHMWFGNIVSPQWWTWLWLNEAFASFWHFTIVDTLKSGWRMTENYVVGSIHAVMSSDSLTSSHPLSVDVESPSEMKSIFDSDTYSKGAAIVRMMSFIMGQDHFIHGLNVYLDDRQYSVANHTHLFHSLDKYLTQQGQDPLMSEVMESWVTQMGYPVVTVHWSAGGQVTLTQQRFLSTGHSDGESVDQAPFGYTWDIPVTMATSDNTNYNVDGTDIIWFNKSEPQLTITSASIPAPPTEGKRSRWLLLNVQQYGYYRVNYPRDNWLALIQQLKTDPSVIHPLNRAQIINDAWSLARSGQLSMTIALHTLQVLKSDNDFVPWAAMSGELRYLDRMLNRQEIYGMFEDYIVQLVNATYQHLGMTSDPNDPPVLIEQRQRIVSYACRYGLQGCRQEATLRFNAWKTDPENNKLEVDMRGIILCNGVRFGDKRDWEFVYEHYLNITPGSEQNDLLQALSCTRTTWLLQRLMTLTLNSTLIKTQNVGGILGSVSDNPIGRDMAFTFLCQHFHQLTTIMGGGSFGSAVVATTQHFNTQSELDEVKLFMSRNDVSSAETSFRKVMEQTSANMKWMQKYYDDVRHFLQDLSHW